MTIYKRKWGQALCLLLILVMLCTACGSADKSGTDAQEAGTAAGSEIQESVNEAGQDLHVQEPATDRTGRYLLSESGEAVVDDIISESAFTAPEDKNRRVFYHIFVGSFSDSDGDGIGDLRGIINRMDYINDGDPDSGLSLGAEGIWLSPIFQSPSYHKYDVTDYYTIDPDFGTMEDLKELVELCHERGVKLILDLVINHTGSHNSWFLDFCNAHRNADTSDPYYSFYCFNDSTKLNGRKFSKISNSDDYYECNFSGDMPEPDFDNEFVRETFLEVARYYLEDIDVDGFRFDAAKYIYYGEDSRNAEFWDWYIDELEQIKPGLYTVAEVWDSDSTTDKYVPALNCFDFSMSQGDGMIAAAAKKGNVNGYTSYVQKYIDRITSLNPDAFIVPFIANHDMDRAAGYLTTSSGYAKVGANLYILGPGSPFIYYGEEIGMKGSRGSSGTDANRRLAMLWGDGDTIANPEGSDFDPEKQINGTVQDQLADANSMYNYYKRLIAIRRANPEIAEGEYKALEFTDTKLGGFVSNLDGSSVGVFHNTTGSRITVDLSQVTDISFTKIVAVIGIAEGDTSLDGTMLTLGEQTSVVLR